MNDRFVRICDVGPRDGLQNESIPVSAADKIRYIELLLEAGFPDLEITSFVSPKHVPQMADADEVFRGIPHPAGRRLLVLVPNERGLDRALDAGADAIVVFTAASEAFTKANIGMTIDESIATFASVVARAKRHGMYVRASVSTAFGCPFQGAVPVSDVVHAAQRLLDIGCDALSIADTIGVGTPNQVEEIVAALAPVVAADRLNLHFHDTRGTALANVTAALRAGVRWFDASAGGLGGCPFAPGATGNVATEDLLYLLHGMGYETGVDLAKVRAASRFINRVTAGRVVSRAFHALEAADARAARA